MRRVDVLHAENASFCDTGSATQAIRKIVKRKSVCDVKGSGLPLNARS
jgi:hypothetical protein